jgi:hypothetical protein
MEPQPVTARPAHDWGVLAEALSQARELAELYLKTPEVTRAGARAYTLFNP